MKKIFHNIVAIFVIIIVFLLIIPLPTQMLDFLFITNLALSFVILLTTMYIQEPLEFSVFYDFVSAGAKCFFHAFHPF